MLALADKKCFMFKLVIVRTPNLVYSSCFIQDQHAKIIDRISYIVNYTWVTL